MEKTSHLRRKLLILSAVLTGLGLAPFPAAANDYPAKPVKIVIPFPPGGVTDMVGRLLGEKLTTMWGQPVIVENRSGASGMIGAEMVTKAPPDGYTLLLSSTAEVAINQSLYDKMNYSPEKDLVPVTLTSTTPVVLVAYPGLGVKTLRELKEAAKKKPISYASAGAGGVQHMAGALLEAKMDLGMNHVPYRGGAPALTDVLGGHVGTSYSSAPLIIDSVKAGKLVALAVMATERLPALPDVPTANESLGAKGLDISNWYGVFAPAGTPDAVIDKINADMVKVLKMPEVRKRISEAGADPVGNSRAEFKDFWQAEIKKYAEIIRISGATAK